MMCKKTPNYVCAANIKSKRNKFIVQCVDIDISNKQNKTKEKRNEKRRDKHRIVATRSQTDKTYIYKYVENIFKYRLLCK